MQKPTTHEVPRRSLKSAQIDDSTSGSSSRRQALVESESAPVICDPVAVSTSLVELAREVARVQGQPATKMGDHSLCRDGRSEESLLERRSVRTLAGRRSYQTALGKFLKFVQKPTLHLVEVVEIDGGLVAYSNVCSVQGAQHYKGS